MEENQDVLTTDTTSPERITAPLEQSRKFKIKLEATKRGDKAISGFSYPVADGFKGWSLEHHGLEVEFDDLNIARSFMSTAIETGGYKVASDSPTKLR